MNAFRWFGLAACLFASAALAETRTFVLDSSDGYGIDSCLSSGEACGKAMAAALCKANGFPKVADFGRMDPTEITGAVPAALSPKTCTGPKCPQKVAITCTR